MPKCIICCSVHLQQIAKETLQETLEEPPPLAETATAPPSTNDDDNSSETLLETKPFPPLAPLATPPTAPPTAPTVVPCTLNSQLLIVYFLKKFLPYELIDLHPLLLNHGNPTDWIWFCSPCQELIKEAQNLDMKLTLLRNKVENVVIQTSLTNEEDEDEVFWAVRNVIRERKLRIKKEIVNSEPEEDEDIDFNDFPIVYPIVKMEENDIFLEPQQQIKRKRGRPPNNYHQLFHNNKRPVGRPKGRRDTFARGKPTDTEQLKLRRRMCPICGRLFSKSSHMTRHLNSVHKKKIYECGVCNMKFNRKDYFIVHKSTHSYTTKDESNITISGGSGSGGSSAVKKEDDKMDDFFGGVAMENIISNDDDDDVVVVGEETNSITLNKRGSKRVKFNQELEEIVLSPSNNSDTNYISEDGDDSDDSDFAINSKKTKKKKKRSIPTKIRKPTISNDGDKQSRKSPLEQRTCPICSEVFRCYSKMTRHLNTKHERNPRFTCEICQKGFLRKDYLKAHMQTHLSQEEKLMIQALKDKRQELDEADLNDSGTEKTRATKLEERTCPVCNKIFEKPSVMKLHLDCVHNNVEAYMCEICSKKFKRKDSLRKHLKIHEEGDEGTRSFKCSFEGCEKGFRRKRDLEVHSRRHSGAKDMLCALCGMSFRHEWSFKRHNILVHHHRPSKKYDCQSCGKIFKIKWHLDQHLKSKSHGGAGLGKRTRKKKTVSVAATAAATSQPVSGGPFPTSNTMSVVPQNVIQNLSLNQQVVVPPPTPPIPNSPVTPASSIEPENNEQILHPAAELLHHNFWQYHQHNNTTQQLRSIDHHHHHHGNSNTQQQHNSSHRNSIINNDQDSSSSTSSHHLLQQQQHSHHNHRDLINYPFGFFTNNSNLINLNLNNLNNN